jgi:hypothetical protein
MAKHRVKISACPHCGAEHDGASNANESDDSPQPGDISLCIECAGGSRFEKGGKLTALSVDKLPPEIVHLRRRLIFAKARAN